MGFSLRKLARKALRVVGAVAPIVELIPGGGVVTRVIKIASRVAPLVRRIIPRKGDPNMNQFEAAVRTLLQSYAAVKDKSGFDIIIGLVPAFGAINELKDAIANRPKEVWKPELRAALDNLIGDEPDAVIGSSPTALIHVDLKIVPTEMVADLVTDLILSRL